MSWCADNAAHCNKHMSLFCGLFQTRRSAAGISDADVRALVCSISRHADARPETRVGDGFALVWLDGEIFDGGMERSSGAKTTLVGGDPIVHRTHLGRSRSQDLDELHAEWARGDAALLRRTRGSFCAVHVDPDAGRMWLLTDKLGLRPIYFAVVGGTVVFATAMRIIESSGLVPRTGDLRGLAETAGFGYALGARSINRLVRSLEAAQVIEVSQSGLRASHYWAWDTISSCGHDRDQACIELRDAFEDAVRIRLAGASEAVSLLSGGLDSRTVVAQLRREGADVHTIGFGPEGSADQVLARQVSAAVGTRHYELLSGVPDFWPRLASAHAHWLANAGARINRGVACQLWTGEGGDRVMAPVNLTEEIAEAMRSGQAANAVAIYMRYEKSGLPRRLFRRRHRDLVLSLPARGLLEELGKRTSDDPARRFHLYVLLNESRRNIKQHFEDLDVSRIELIMPFYDSHFVEIALRYPLDIFLRHRLYHRWLKYLPPVVSSVPWQAYPVSEPCPLPLPAGIRSQWQRWYSRDEERAVRRQARQEARKLLAAPEFPTWLINRPLLRVAEVLTRAGGARFEYLFDKARPFVSCPPPPLADPEARL